MIASTIGILLGFIVIFLFIIMKQFDKKMIYGLILCAIGFLYVGFVWKDMYELIINCLQALFFLFLAYFGMKKSVILLAGGFFLHGCWDITYPCIRDASLIPPHYDLFCLSIDFVMGIYIFAFKKHFAPKSSIS